MNSQNFDKLDRDTLALIHFGFEAIPVGWSLMNMIEVKLDNPVDNIIDGKKRGDVLQQHTGVINKAEYCLHFGDPEWAIVSLYDEEWKALDKTGLFERAVEILVEKEVISDEPASDPV